MELLSVPRLLISGIKSEVGKALFGIGLTHELRRRGVSVSCCVTGTNLVQALLYRRLSARYVRTLDERLLSSTQVAESVFFAGVGANLVLIHGKAGLFDGTGIAIGRGSDAELAALLRCPVALVVDGRGFGASLAAAVKGFIDMAQGFDIVGAVVNRAGFEGITGVHGREFFDESFEFLGQRKPIGVIPELGISAEIPPRKLLQDQNRTSLPLAFFLEIAGAVGKHVDVDELLARASNVTTLRLRDLEHKPGPRVCRIGFADDGCFGLCYQDNLDLLRYFGAEIVTFSPLADIELPRDCGALYLPGAFLGEYGEELAANDRMRRAIREFADAGGVIYSEGGSTAYLCRRFRCGRDAPACDGVGVLPGSAFYSSGEFSYRESISVDDSILGAGGSIIKGVHPGDWRISEDDTIPKLLRVSQLRQPTHQEGYSPRAQVLATFCFNHMGSNPQIARNLVEAASVVRSISAED